MIRKLLPAAALLLTIHVHAAEVLVADVRGSGDEMKDVKGPWFMVVYGAMQHGPPHRFKDLADHLPPDRFKIVRLDEFFAAAAKARNQMEGRV